MSLVFLPIVPRDLQKLSPFRNRFDSRPPFGNSTENPIEIVPRNIIPEELLGRGTIGEAGPQRFFFTMPNMPIIFCKTKDNPVFDGPRFSGEEMIARMKVLPSVDFPSSITLILSDFSWRIL